MDRSHSHLMKFWCEMHPDFVAYRWPLAAVIATSNVIRKWRLKQRRWWLQRRSNGAFHYVNLANDTRHSSHRFKCTEKNYFGWRQRRRRIRMFHIQNESWQPCHLSAPPPDQTKHNMWRLHSFISTNRCFTLSAQMNASVYYCMKSIWWWLMAHSLNTICFNPPYALFSPSLKYCLHSVLCFVLFVRVRSTEKKTLVAWAVRDYGCCCCCCSCYQRAREINRITSDKNRWQWDEYKQREKRSQDNVVWRHGNGSEWKTARTHTPQLPETGSFDVRR